MFNTILPKKIKNVFLVRVVLRLNHPKISEGDRVFGDFNSLIITITIEFFQTIISDYRLIDRL